ncbi:hypothetical protein BC826DRAFT_1103404 [Russula brevipes]|nr:hypothetical protein BC826DRAFT_1103404 [Russula brevipes]
MAFNPVALLILEFRGRSISVLRRCCTTYEDIIAVAQSTFPYLQNFAVDAIVLRATLPDYPYMGSIELSAGTWEASYALVSIVKISLRQGIMPVQRDIQDESRTPVPAPHRQPDYSLTTSMSSGIMPVQRDIQDESWTPDIITIARSTFSSLRELPIEAIVIMAHPPDPRVMKGYAEFASGTWETVSGSVPHVEIGLKSEREALENQIPPG